MSTHDRLVFAIALTSLCALGGFAFVIWLFWNLFWEIYDHVTGGWKRIESSRIDASHITHQFQVPRSMCDYKDRLL